MASVQELETKVDQLSRMVEFVMKAISVSQPSPLAGMPPRVASLLDLFYASNAAGLTIDAEPVKEAEVVSA